MRSVRLEKIVFFGTPEFAIPTLDALVVAGRRPALVVAQPARPAGRGKTLREPPVALRARALGLELVQPPKVREPEFIVRLAALDPDLAVVVAFGQIFPSALLAVPRQGCINVHASLLPRHRGAAPIQAAIAAGDAVTGVTTMRMEAGLDSGPMYLRAETPIGEGETAGDLAPRLARMGADLLLATLDRLEAGSLVATPQNDTLATLAPKIDRARARLDWRQPAQALARHARAFSPWPGVETTFRGAPLKIVRLAAVEGALGARIGQAAEPGAIVRAQGGEFEVACGDSTTVLLLEVQRAGRRAVAARDFLNGERPRVGERLGP